MSDKKDNKNTDLVSNNKNLVSNNESSLDIFDDVWGDDYDSTDQDIDNEFSDLSLNDKGNKLEQVDDLDAAFDQIISHYEMSSTEKKMIEEAENKKKEEAKQKELQENKKKEEQAKRNKMLEERRKKREKKNKKFANKNKISTSTAYQDKYDEYADDYYDY